MDRVEIEKMLKELDAWIAEADGLPAGAAEAHMTAAWETLHRDASPEHREWVGKLLQQRMHRLGLHDAALMEELGVAPLDDDEMAAIGRL